jgi:hypothetical protein
MVHFACMPSLIPRQVGWNLFARTIPFASAFPETGAGRLLHCRFRGLLSVYSGYGLHARQVAYATLYTEGFSSFVASAAASIATGWSEPVPGRVYPRCGPPPFHGAPGNATNSLLKKASQLAIASAARNSSSLKANKKRDFMAQRTSK